MSKFKEGDVVVCEAEDYNYVTFQKKYTVIRENFGSPHFYLVDDEGDESIYSDQYFKLSQEVLTTEQVIEQFCTEETPVNAPVVSDGLSTSYYQLKITNKNGDTIDCEMGDVIRCTVGDNFSLGNVLKAARRMYEASQGRGKKDVSMNYDANKIAYFAKEFADFYGSKNEK